MYVHVCVYVYVAGCKVEYGILECIVWRKQTKILLKLPHYNHIDIVCTFVLVLLIARLAQLVNPLSAH